MNRKEITLIEYQKLRDCIVTPMYGNTSRKSKIIRVNKRTTLIAEIYNNSVMQILYKNSEVKIIDKELQ